MKGGKITRITWMIPLLVGGLSLLGLSFFMSNGNLVAFLGGLAVGISILLPPKIMI
jgi:hypothetical protein